jgi:crotonobetainyl-CoA:carnitine CoA-transferase CaiB-like acyl-CoA transferase
VIRVEPHEGDPMRWLIESGMIPPADYNWLFEMLNRNKRSIAVNLSHDSGRKIVQDLAKDADVFLANLRPKTLKRAGLDYETLERLNPRLIYAGITGYGPRGPGADWRAYDEIAFWARSGLMASLGEPDTPLVPLRGSIGDHTTGMFALGGIALALYGRERTGKGQQVDVSLLGSGVWAAGIDVQAALVYQQEIGRTSRKTISNPLYNHYECRDGRSFQFQMLESNRFWTGVCKALEREELEHDPRFDSHKGRTQNAEELIAILDEIFSTRDRDEWEPRFNENDLVWGAVQAPLEVTRDPCVLENDYITEYEHETAGTVRGITCPIQLSRNPMKAPSTAPECGQHTEEVLLELGYSPEDIEALRENKVIPA